MENTSIELLLPYQAISLWGIRFSVIFLAIMLLVIIDLIMGWQRAKRLGIPRRSHAVARTFTKILQYSALLFIASACDFCMLVNNVYAPPYLSLVVLGIVLFREGKSVLEKFDPNDRQSLEQAAKALAQVAKTRGDLEQIAQLALAKFDQGKIPYTAPVPPDPPAPSQPPQP